MIVLLILMMLCYAFQSLFCKLYAKNCTGDSKESSLFFAVIFGSFIAVATFAVGCLSAREIVFHPSRLTVIFGVCNAVFLVVFHLSQIGATSRGSYAIANLCMLFGGMLIPMVSSVIRLGQGLSLVQIVAVVLMLGAFVLLNCQGLSLGGSKPGYWFCCVALALSNGFYGAVLALQANLTADGERIEMLTISYLGSALLAGIVLAVLRMRKTPGREAFHMSRRALGFALACCVVATVAANIILYLLARMNVTVLNTVNNGGVLLLAALFGLFLFKERPSKLQYCGLAVALGSVILLSL